MEKQPKTFISIYWYHDDEPSTFEVDPDTIEATDSMFSFATPNGSSYVINKKSFDYLKFWEETNEINS